jgi:hypothetical protein
MDDNSVSHTNRAFEVSQQPRSGEAGMYFVACVLIVLFAGAANSYFLTGWYVGLGPGLSQEHGPMEDVQLCALGIALALFLFAYSKGTGAVKAAAATLSILIAAGLIREIDVKSIGGPDWLRWLARHGLQEVLFALMTVPIPVYLLMKRRYFRDLLRLAMRREALFLCAAGTAIFIGSVILDRKVTHTDDVRFWEEFIEYNGYLLFAAAAWFHARLVGDPRYSAVLD